MVDYAISIQIKYCIFTSTDLFKPGPGIYLFLGYSRDEMEIMKTHTHMNENEALGEIQKLLRDKYGFKVRFYLPNLATYLT